ncbi:uncharacterized protein SPPG_07763 [Spizellomyces punctatus DAOM BR117]|uniref:Cleft lip and palate transmembrane protein 1 n=1 Tax=Spizellomyces punctatus (strain DAOM BR117) TaxID=645134 RepID=A0A0L0H5Z9_SPIPD|nr:uncharacterized protein SPPG_07763 [Spizellomyces punctatus DAOM BR117]KNC96940.1 hypothetical protein SPPG_07763 [Spizellomyces punctatus DAOM BR117]|eukprot:XP_016604980.1 hypothetical protein SPPG_07763 [Spizellomyces punctatus DAOM BR117]
MADTQPPAGTQQGQAPGQQQNGGGVMSIIQSVGRIVLIYWVVNFFASSFRGSNQPVPATTPNGKGVPNALLPLWEYGRSTDLHVFLAENEYLSSLEQANLIWKESNIVYGDWEERRKDLQIDAPESVQNNGSLYAHIFLTVSGHSPDRKDQTFDEESTLYYRKQLTRYMPKKKVKKMKSLVSKAEDADVQELQEEDDNTNEETTIISYWWPNVTISIINSKDPIPAATPPQLMRNVRTTHEGKHYFPVFYVNDFWMLSDQLSPINTTVKTLNVSLSYSPMAWWKYQMYTQFEESFRMQNTMMGVASSETDEMKRMFLETNPILLGVTMVVSLLHSAFDFLAFKNDIQFWQKRKNMEGLSFRTIVLNVFFQTVIFLYLLDNETSWMVVISSGVGLLIEAWKIQKTVIVRRKDTFPFVEFIDRVKPSKLVSKTQEYDELAFKYLSYALYPCLAGYAVYSLLYQEHKSWYSYVLGTLVGFVYAFGFITMTPQLFINYKLKSVAHMPWKTFMYKALNTFVDDLFAFVIKMPTLHRLACLRDDVIFLVYLYQKWIYPEDKRRRNEFGQVGEEGADDEEESEAEEEEPAGKNGKTSPAASSKTNEKESKKDK